MAAKRDLVKTKAVKRVTPQEGASPETNPLGAAALPSPVIPEVTAPPEVEVGTTAIQPGIRKIGFNRKSNSLAVLKYTGESPERALQGVPTRSKYKLDPYNGTVTIYIQDLEHLLKNPDFKQLS